MPEPAADNAGSLLPKHFDAVLNLAMDDLPSNITV